MKRFVLRQTTRALLGAALISSLAACVVQPIQPVVREAPPDPHRIAIHRFEQVSARIDHMHRRIEHNVNVGYYPPPRAGMLHRRLDGIWHEAQNIAGHQAGGLSGEQQRQLNTQLDNLGEEIR